MDIIEATRILYPGDEIILAVVKRVEMERKLQELAVFLGEQKARMEAMLDHDGMPDAEIEFMNNKQQEQLPK